MSVNIVSSFRNKGVPATGLSPLLNIWEIDGTPVVVSGTMTEVAGGFYLYSFTSYVSSTDYMFLADGGPSLSDVDRYSDSTNEDEYDVTLSGIQADLDNSDQYKADVSALAIEANVEGHATDALNSYDSPTRTEATSDKDEIIVEVNANETKLDTIDGVVDAIKTDIEFIKKIEGGWWKLDAATNQMLFYDEDGNGPIATFNLYNVDGVASVENVYRRERV